MSRRIAVGLVVWAVVVTGCLHDGDWASFEKALGWDSKPKPPKFSPASLQTAERVENLGRRIITQNTFTGLEPLFHTIGVPELVLFHRGTGQLFVSEGLVNRCKTDGELAAVLCTELAQMIAEDRAARGVGRDRDPIPEVGPDGKAAEKPAREKPAARADSPADPAKIARDLLRGAGFDPAELDRVEPLLKQTDRGEALRKQMAGSAPAPVWNK